MIYTDAICDQIFISVFWTICVIDVCIECLIDMNYMTLMLQKYVPLVVSFIIVIFILFEKVYIC